MTLLILIISLTFYWIFSFIFTLSFYVITEKNCTEFDVFLALVIGWVKTPILLLVTLAEVLAKWCVEHTIK